MLCHAVLIVSGSMKSFPGDFLFGKFLITSSISFSVNGGESSVFGGDSVYLLMSACHVVSDAVSSSGIRLWRSASAVSFQVVVSVLSILMLDRAFSVLSLFVCIL